MKGLGITETPTSATIKILNGNLTNQSLAVGGFEVKAAAVSEHRKWAKLPKTFSCDELPVDTDDAASPEKISDITVGLLVGANCAKALSLTG